MSAKIVGPRNPKLTYRQQQPPPGQTPTGPHWPRRVTKWRTPWRISSFWSNWKMLLASGAGWYLRGMLLYAHKHIYILMFIFTWTIYTMRCIFVRARSQRNASCRLAIAGSLTLRSTGIEPYVHSMFMTCSDQLSYRNAQQADWGNYHLDSRGR